MSVVPPGVRPFRAGRLPGAHTGVLPSRTTAAFTSGDTLLADVSEFQPNVTDAAYLAWSKAVIIRAAYGDAHDDRAWYGGARRAALHAGGAKFVGIYQYIVASQDPVTQAQALISLVGAMEPGELLLADIEEGAGSQQQRWIAWADTIAQATGFAPHDYSGLNFAAGAGIEPVWWLADYSSAEPAVPHTLWQFTDSFTVPGVGLADCSVYHGTVDQLAALAYGGTVTTPPVVQKDWAWCPRCQGSFYAGPGNVNTAKSHCPAPGGGPHVNGGYNYGMQHT